MGVIITGAASYQGWAAQKEPLGKSEPLSARMTASQYRETIAYTFGPAIKINGRFDPEERDEGLQAIGAQKSNVTDSAFERYANIGRDIAAQVVSPQYRNTLIPCKPALASGADDACAKHFISSAGRLLYRRPLTESEQARLVLLARQSANKTKDFYVGLANSLEAMLVSPNFLYRYRRASTDPISHGQMDGYSKASQLSFMLWNAGPDKKLLDAAERGELTTADGLQRQVDRMLSSPRLEAGVRAFFADMLGFSEFEQLSKDGGIYPRFTSKVREDALEQTLKTIVDHLIVRNGDYRDLFTTPHTYLTRSLAAVYGVPFVEVTDNAQPQHWLPYTYADGDPRLGILTHVSFVALHSHAGRTSPTLRGKALRENIMCQTVPPPPGNVDFTLVQEATRIHRTARERLQAHAGEPMCAGCHKITDPVGLALENFDSAGGYRETETGVVIDTSGELGRVKFSGSAGLAKAIRDEPAVPSCVARRAFAFGSGHLPAGRDPEWTKIEAAFKESNFNFVTLLRELALSDLLYAMPAQSTN